ncbi:MAG: hypothetical protein KDB27_04035 [Planctomycetales bacterium]|nr:hypothetical protein [Planctomycetales bacterium]
MKSVLNGLNRLVLVTSMACILPAVASAAPIFFGPTAYLSDADIPINFYDADCVDGQGLEDFEDNSLDPFLTIDNGSILQPFTTSGLPSSVTDSVDGDDGSIDGNGNAGHSWFYGGGRDVTITFDSPVISAGLVWTDGPSFADVLFEAFDADGNSLGTIGPVDIADAFYTGETSEDHFFGVRDEGGIGSISISVTSGSGIELDHIAWNIECVPEPGALALSVFGVLGMFALRQR